MKPRKTNFPFQEICDNIPGQGCNLDDWNTSYGGCNCFNELVSHTENDFLNNTNKNKDEENDNNNEFSNLDIRNKNANVENYNNYVYDKNIRNKKCEKNKSITCNNSLCTCIILKSNYNQNGLLNVCLSNLNWHESIYQINECNSECDCNEEDCSNRIVQNGRKLKLDVFDSGLKGTGVRALEPIPKGSFVIEYLGEVIGEVEAEKLFKLRSENSESNYIMYLKEFYKSDNSTKTTIIDAKNYSNIARFINHSCDPNLFVLPVRINSIIPHAALFALKDISPMEELSYDYNGGSTDDAQKFNSLKNKCFCGASNCKGYLPNNFQFYLFFNKIFYKKKNFC